MTKIRVKLCGFTQVEDIQTAICYGADAIGLIFTENSDRAVSIETAKILADAITPYVNLTGVFANNSKSQINTILQAIPLDNLQFHGDESPEFCECFNKNYIKAIRFEKNWNKKAEYYKTAQGILLDSDCHGQFGGTGQPLDWQNIKNKISKPLILAGGLTSQNVKQAIEFVQPYGIDVSSGIEISKGIKSAEKINQLMTAVRDIPL